MIKLRKKWLSKSLRTTLIALILVNWIFFINLTLVQAASNSYKAHVVVYSPAQKLKLKAGTTTKLRINYINTGSNSWLNSGANAVKLKTDALGQNFAHSQWLSASMPTKLYYPKVAPGKSIWFDIPIVAPKINGTYSFNLSLTAGANTISGSAASFKLTVTGGKTAATSNQLQIVNGLIQILQITELQKANLPIIVEPNLISGYQLKYGNQSIDINKLGSSFQIDFNFSLKKYFINDQNGQRLLMTDSTITFIPTNLTDQLKLTAGLKYTFCGRLNFAYQSDSQSLSVLTDAPQSCYPQLIPGQPTPLPPPQFWQVISPDLNIVNDFRFTQEPIIKVGLLYQTNKSDDELPFKIHTFNNHAYEVRDDNNNLLTLATAGDMLDVNFDFKLKRYFVNSGGVRLFMTDSPIHFIAQSPETIFEIASWKNGPFWGMNVNDNDFRGNLIIKYNPNTERLWLINEISMEKYLRGNSEIWDSWPIEMIKAQMIAARTYALFRYLNPKYTNSPSPDDDPIFTVRSTQADQVYRGYQAELRNPYTVQSVNDTSGLVATYNNDPISAYYFAQSDGRTRSSSEAGMTKAPVDYLQSVLDPPGERMNLKGHGVGMPQVGGKVAAQEGANFSQILKYYYRGIELKKFYP